MAYKDKEKQKQYQTAWMRARRLAWIEAQGGKCIACGSPDSLEVDHIDPSTKVSHGVWSWSEERRSAELAKCQLLCQACHVNKSCIEKFGHEPYAHGSVRTYRIKGCRCGLCREARARIARAYKKRKRDEKRSERLARKLANSSVVVAQLARASDCDSEG